MFYMAKFRMRSREFYINIPIMTSSMIEAVQLAEAFGRKRMPKAYLVGVSILARGG